MVQCESYAIDAVRLAILRPGESIVLEPNWLAAAAPEEAVTTHPAVFQAGANLSYGDSPAVQSPELVAKEPAFTPLARP